MNVVKAVLLIICRHLGAILLCARTMIKLVVHVSCCAARKLHAPVNGDGTLCLGHFVSVFFIVTLFMPQTFCIFYFFYNVRYWHFYSTLLPGICALVHSRAKVTFVMLLVTFCSHYTRSLRRYG